MKLSFIASDLLGGGCLRSIWPANALIEQGHKAEVRIWDWPAPTDNYDAVIMHRPLSKFQPRQLKRYIEAGMKVWVDEDDDLTRVLETDNEIGKMVWTPEAQDMHDWAIENASGLLVSTQPLKDIYGKLNPNVHICRNYVPRWIQNIKFFGRGSQVRVGWAGITMTHAHDLRWLSPFSSLAFRGAIFTTVGDVATMRHLRVDGDSEWFPFQWEMAALYQLMARADIGIVPLDPMDFNRSKSWLKALEYMTLGKPVVVTNLPEQALLIEQGVQGFLADTPQEFAEYVQLLVHDQGLRETMGRAAKEKAASLAIEKSLGQWEVALGEKEKANAGS